MNIKFTFKHMKTSDALRVYAEEKVMAKVEKFVSKPIDAHVTFSVDNLENKVHLSLHGGDGFDVQADQTSLDMYASIDLLVDKLGVQLKKQKEKLKDHKQHGLWQVVAPGVSEGVNGETSDLAAVRVREDELDAGEVLALERARQHRAGASV